jgi:hypothetical protein
VKAAATRPRPARDTTVPPHVAALADVIGANIRGRSAAGLSKTAKQPVLQAMSSITPLIANSNPIGRSGWLPFAVGQVQSHHSAS